MRLHLSCVPLASSNTVMREWLRSTWLLQQSCFESWVPPLVGRYAVSKRECWLAGLP